MTTSINKAIELLESFGVKKSVTVTNGSPSFGIKSDSENSYYVIESANGIKTIELSNDVDIDGVFEEEKIPGMLVASSWKSDQFNSPEYPIYILYILSF